MATDTEQAIEAARELLLLLHLETMTGAALVSPAVQDLMAALDEAIYVWDCAQATTGEGGA